MGKKRSRRSSAKDAFSLIRASSGNSWVFSHPRQVRDCSEDLEEVREMLAEGEWEIALDELHWLLELSHEMLAAHFLLGKIAVESQDDVELGRGHFGAGYQLGLQAWRRAGKPTPVPALHPANRIFFDCGRGLAWSLHHLSKTPLAIEVVEHMLALDPNDPLGLASWIDEMRTGGGDIVEIHGLFE